MWWHDAVVYQVYVRSFADTDGDGLGDLPGIRARLPYLQALGVDAVWLTPFYPSPDADHGYDVSDHLAVDPRFGTLDDLDGLIDDAHALGLRVLLDLVPNHTSSEHPWFRAALADPDHPDRRRYVFRPGRAGAPPNGWTSAFGGPAWTLDDTSGEWYLHFFAPQQPDLDWHNGAVRRDFEDVLRFWLDRGVDGFRIDVAQALFKDAELRDLDEPDPIPWWADWHTATNQADLHPLYRRWRSIVDAYPGDRILVGEIVLRDQAALARYVRSDELHLAFNFALFHDDWDADALRATIDRTLAAFGAVDAPPCWVLENHDAPRLPTRYGGGAVGRRRARAAALLLLALPGAAFVYQGQELGLEEVDLPESALRDPAVASTAGVVQGRDGCRVPLPWGGAPPAFGFSTGEPWLPMPASWSDLTVEAQRDDPASALTLYRTALARRPTGTRFTWRAAPPGVLAFDRDHVTCVVNVDAASVELPPGQVIASSDPDAGSRLPSATAAWVRRAVCGR